MKDESTVIMVCKLATWNYLVLNSGKTIMFNCKQIEIWSIHNKSSICFSWRWVICSYTAIASIRSTEKAHLYYQLKNNSLSIQLHVIGHEGWIHSDPKLVYKLITYNYLTLNSGTTIMLNCKQWLNLEYTQYINNPFFSEVGHLEHCKRMNYHFYCSYYHLKKKVLTWLDVHLNHVYT